jgi:hypothetical protein
MPTEVAAAHLDYLLRPIPEAVEQNRQQQRMRHHKRRLAELVKNNLVTWLWT